METVLLYAFIIIPAYLWILVLFLESKRNPALGVLWRASLWLIPLTAAGLYIFEPLHYKKYLGILLGNAIVLCLKDYVSK